MADGIAADKKFVRIERTYFNKAEEGWVKQGRVFNVGAEHTKGLTTVTYQRANALVQRGIAAWHKEGDSVKQAGATDPVSMKEEGLRQRIKEAPPKRQGVDTGRRTKVDPPVRQNPQPTRKKTDEAPPAPEKFTAPRRQAPNNSPRKTASVSGGPTGAAPGSPSSSPEAPVSAKSTGKPRGQRRGTAATQTGAASASVQSTKVGSSGQKGTHSTGQTSRGGESGKASESSEG